MATALDLKEHVEQKDLMHRYGRQDIIYVMLDKRIDDIREDMKDLRSETRSEFAAVRGDVKELRNDVKELRGDVKVMQESIKQGNTLNKWIFRMLVTLILGLAGLAVPVILSLIN